MKASRIASMRPESSSSSLRKMMSSGVRAQLMKLTSVAGAQSKSQRVIDIMGVMPEPAEMKRYLSPGWLASEKNRRSAHRP